MTDDPGSIRSTTDLSAPDVVVDARGRPCPVPVIELARAFRRVPVGGLAALLADDPAAASDVPAWCRMRAQQLVAAEPDADGWTRYTVRRLR